ncbi:MAG TPA: gliding motility-associated ABC transporter permease subunit GldF [Flavobacteriales bacterium]|jgi:ABC-2 type transport system permease protein|nr:gliding motility-associated ABC transporter permease subunit GldF [Salibacteraceae bacterium]HAS35679.1 gliding motility-associated ABC transporter permease subunit GldF [Flavobacteriales bacterium]
MISLLRREISSFLNSLIGYIVISLFLVTIGLFMWIFPGEFNVLDSGYANIDTLFIIAPWVFIFLGPAITMRSFSEEFRTGTIELIMTKPLTDWEIVMAKFLAGIILIVLALLPSLVYVYTIGQLGATAWNLDTGALWGSYIGLLFIASGFVAIGLFASSLSSNQIVAFIVGVFLSFFCFVGFESISGLSAFTGIELIIARLGINEHYISMSRGVIDTRDLLYFLSLIVVFVAATKLKLESRNW